VAAKDSARAAMIATLRPVISQIQRNRGVSQSAKLALGLTPHKNGRSRVPSPFSNPILAVIGATPGEHTLRYADANTPASRAKPAGTIGLQLFLKVAPRPAGSPVGAKLYATATRQPIAVKFKHADNGKTATYFGRWIARSGAVGPWSSPVSAVIVA
jgi:hypothetical protein